jgi:hypothetical protein
MRVTVSHNKNPQEVIRSVDRGFDEIFKGMPMGPIQITDEQRTWVGSTLNFSFNANAGFMKIPVKGIVQVEETQVTIDVDLPSFISQFFPEEKIKTVLQDRVRGLLQ